MTKKSILMENKLKLHICLKKIKFKAVNLIQRVNFTENLL